MANDIPEWARIKAVELTNAAVRSRFEPIDEYRGPWTLVDTEEAENLQAFARYIAAHEKAPVDPLLIEAREIAATEVEDAIKNHQRYMRSPASYRSGENDDEPGLKAVLAALRRGIELAKAGAS